MFTPPPSPLPPFHGLPPPSTAVSPDELPSHPVEPPSSSVLFIPIPKRRFLPSSCWSIILVPLLLIFIAAMTRFAAHPAAFDILIPGAKTDPDFWTHKIVDWRPHPRHGHLHSDHHPDGNPAPPFRRDTTSTSSIVPAVPQNPTLPLPFPQPFDTTLSTNFSSNECYNFFLNMTQTTSFRSCRPFSLLLTHSAEFQQDQTNITAMNIDVWGTCNTVTPWDQCSANLQWFASALKSACQIDLKNENLMAASTLTALQAYDTMRNASCRVNPATGSYCYVESVANSDPSSYWFYLLPLGHPLVNITSSACNECMQNLMALYSNALHNDTLLDGLKQTYGAAAKSLDAACGADYAVSTTVNAALGRDRIPYKRAVLLGISIVHLYSSLF